MLPFMFKLVNSASLSLIVPEQTPFDRNIWNNENFLPIKEQQSDAAYLIKSCMIPKSLSFLEAF